jgi:16S rRNA processing protein RimM
MERGSDPPFLVVAHLQKVHGTKGEFLVRSLTDRPQTTFLPGAEFRIGDARARKPDEFFPPVRIAEVREHRGGYLIRFQGIEDRTRAEFLRGRYLLRPFSEVEPAEEGELFYHQLLGMAVVTVEGRELGTVREVFELDPADLLDVTDGTSEYLIPFTQQVVVRIEEEERRIVVDPPEGLLEL